MTHYSRPFIFTEIYKCGKIARVALSSFLKYHPDLEINIFGTQEDFKWILDLKHEGKFKFVNISNEKHILRKWDMYGHLGTAELWSKVILDSNTSDLIIHFDSDVIFFAPALDELIKKLADGKGLVGTARSYKYNRNGIDKVRHLPDVVQTAIFGFNKKFINKHPHREMVRMALGAYNPKGHPVIDFFDPVMFEILGNGGEPYFLKIEEYGGASPEGSRTNSFGNLNEVMDYGSKFCHFASVGSGMKFYHDFNSRKHVANTYIQHGIDRYILFCKLFYNQDLGVNILEEKIKKLEDSSFFSGYQPPPMEKNKYQSLEDKLTIKKINLGTLCAQNIWHIYYRIQSVLQKTIELISH